MEAKEKGRRSCPSRSDSTREKAQVAVLEEAETSSLEVEGLEVVVMAGRQSRRVLVVVVGRAEVLRSRKALVLAQEADLRSRSRDTEVEDQGEPAACRRLVVRHHGCDRSSEFVGHTWAAARRGEGRRGSSLKLRGEHL